jgi:hypothetical protein
MDEVEVCPHFTHNFCQPRADRWSHRPATLSVLHGWIAPDLPLVRLSASGGRFYGDVELTGIDRRRLMTDVPERFVEHFTGRTALAATSPQVLDDSRGSNQFRSRRAGGSRLRPSGWTLPSEKLG